MSRHAFLFILIVWGLISLITPGCCVTQAAIDTAKTAAAGSDRYTTLTSQVLDGSASVENGPVVTKEDLQATPESVRVLLGRLLMALHTTRYALHSVLFQANAGDDPAGMNLQPITLPELASDVAPIDSGH